MFLQLYRKQGEKQFARQAFDCARSIDPSLALPWAGMSADFHSRLNSLSSFDLFFVSSDLIFVTMHLVYKESDLLSNDLFIFRESAADEAYESCLRAVQILPVSFFFLPAASYVILIWCIRKEH